MPRGPRRGAISVEALIELRLPEAPTTDTWGQPSSIHMWKAQRSPRVVIFDILGAINPALGSQHEILADGQQVVITALGQPLCRIVVSSGRRGPGTVLGIPAIPIAGCDIVMLGYNTEGRSRKVAHQTIMEAVVRAAAAFSRAELEAVDAAMPILGSFAQSYRGTLSDYAIIWRDHFLEENIPLLRAFVSSGVPAQWVFALDKGDQTEKRARICAHFERSGYSVDLFDNRYVDPAVEARETSRIRERIVDFVGLAQRSGKQVLLIDDGALVVKCLRDSQRLFVGGLELTRPGVQRLRDLGSLDIPIYNLAESDLKLAITYPEIAESCVVRIRELMGDEKVIGRPVVVVGYGAIGEHVSRILGGLGARVTVVDRDLLRLTQAAERGLRTERTVESAIATTRPFLMIGCAGEEWLAWSNLGQLPSGAYVTAVASRDLMDLGAPPAGWRALAFDGIGRRLLRPDGGTVVQLGDGRSINLFGAEAIPNRANDVYKTAILVCAVDLARRHNAVPNGLLTAEANAAIAKAGLVETYYTRYLG